MASKHRISVILPVILITAILTVGVVIAILYGYTDKIKLWGKKAEVSTLAETRAEEAVQSRTPTENRLETKLGGDAAEMALIPAGKFQMGSEVGENNETPVHTVYVDAFYIDKYEVTNAQYRLFVQTQGYREPRGVAYVDGIPQGYFRPWSDNNFNGDNLPAVCVSWPDAQAYCEWAGKRLPTEAEWEKAACGGLMGKRYPWGDELTHDKANYPGIEGLDQWEGPAPVDSFEPNGYGLYNMAGNVWEWCSDWYDDDYYSISPGKNPSGPETGAYRVLRGGSWSSPFNFLLRVSLRNHTNPPIASYNVGFRCAKSASSAKAAP